VRNLSIKLRRIYARYTNITYHAIYSVRYYLRFSVTAVGLGTYYPCIRRSTCTWMYIPIHLLRTVERTTSTAAHGPKMAPALQYAVRRVKYYLCGNAWLLTSVSETSNNIS